MLAPTVTCSRWHPSLQPPKASRAPSGEAKKGLSIPSVLHSLHEREFYHTSSYKESFTNKFVHTDRYDYQYHHQETLRLLGVASPIRGIHQDSNQRPNNLSRCANQHPATAGETTIKKSTNTKPRGSVPLINNSKQHFSSFNASRTYHTPSTTTTTHHMHPKSKMSA